MQLTPTPDPHLRSDYTLTGMTAGCCTSDWKRGFNNHPNKGWLKLASQGQNSQAPLITTQIKDG